MEGSCPASTSEPEVPSYLKGKPEEFRALTDAVLVVQGTEFPVHKQVLSAASPFFADLFLGVASGEGPTRHELVPEGSDHPLTVGTFELFLGMVYGALANWDRPQSVEEAEELLPLADFLGEDKLLSRAALRKYLALASRYKLRELMARLPMLRVAAFPASG
ncbi:hypothetical protein N2152v2_009457 [Parachlorella kessleri]